MISIYICEDNKQELENITTCIEDYVMINALDMKVELATDDPVSLLNHVKRQSRGNNLYFLDIDLGNDTIGGIQLAASIRSFDVLSPIVFVTSHDELVLTTFKHAVEALGYIIKDGPDSCAGQIRQILDLVNKRYLTNPNNYRVFTVRCEDSVRIFNVNDIIYFQTSDTHRVIMTHNKGQIEFRMSMKEVEKADPDFIRCHESFIVNRSHISEISKSKRLLKLSNGSICEMSFRRMKQVLDAIN
ncbi:LytTR family DNA-binding domain-containing protein [Aerococcus sp. UMB1112A]|uniref:LytR/AlgR family response regulator transcription factor n=1 Tax=Aerococcus sp. UMB1112A TaxID=3050609 RepID=UPI00254A4355|nr:LytTR family DNA-binding domain-containing protein [Aerococcus sp. UMB1112A]MDK8502845.1 LytTR family DNA-binding domain-containing protein [Aerococcus sp. UMB1112A]